MKRIANFVLLVCFCLSLAGCGASNNASAAAVDKSASSPAASAVAPSEAPAETPAAAPSEAPAETAAPETNDLQAIVDSLNDEELVQRTEDDPSIGIFEVGKAPNTINYKFAMHIFEYVIMMAEAGNAENLNAYNRLLDSLPALENSLENALHESFPELQVDVLLMVDEYSADVAAVVHDGAIIYDVVNGVGTAPADITPIIEPVELPPEVQAQLDELTGSMTGETIPAG